MNRLAPSLLIASLLLVAPNLRAQEEPIPPARPKPKAAGAHAAKPKPKPFTGKQVSINDAGKAELKKLPGITDALAARIIAGRPYRTKAELVLRQILPMNVYEPIKHRITGRPDSETKPKAK